MTHMSCSLCTYVGVRINTGYEEANNISAISRGILAVPLPRQQPHSYRQLTMVLNAEKTIPLPPVIPYDKQSVEVPGTRRPGQTGTFPQHAVIVQLHDLA